MRKAKTHIAFIFIVLTLIFTVSCSQKGYSSWHLNELNIDKLWEYSKGSSQVIAFIDTGISPDFRNSCADRIIFEYSVIDDSENVLDLHGHGTEMISVACNSDYKDVYGIAPESKIIVIKAVSDEGKTNNNYLYKALVVAEEQGATIVNISLGGYKHSDKVEDQIAGMIDKGISIVAAAGD